MTQTGYGERQSIQGERMFGGSARVGCVLSILVALIAPAAAQSPAPVISDFPIARPVVARHGMVVSQEAAASRVGVDILKRGGNAVDAGVAVGLALAVTLPRAGNLGGGGFMLIHLVARFSQIEG